jgi:hypothetical protein
MASDPAEVARAARCRPDAAERIVEKRRAIAEPVQPYQRQ